ncbi:hypothetical protein ABK040_003312 [Willaertia magna]
MIVKTNKEKEKKFFSRRNINHNNYISLQNELQQQQDNNIIYNNNKMNPTAASYASSSEEYNKPTINPTDSTTTTTTSTTITLNNIFQQTDKIAVRLKNDTFYEFLFNSGLKGQVYVRKDLTAEQHQQHSSSSTTTTSASPTNTSSTAFSMFQRILPSKKEFELIGEISNAELLIEKSESNNKGMVVQPVTSTRVEFLKMIRVSTLMKDELIVYDLTQNLNNLNNNNTINNLNNNANIKKIGIIKKGFGVTAKKVIIRDESDNETLFTLEGNRFTEKRSFRILLKDFNNNNNNKTDKLVGSIKKRFLGSFHELYNFTTPSSSSSYSGSSNKSNSAHNATQERKEASEDYGIQFVGDKLLEDTSGKLKALVFAAVFFIDTTFFDETLPNSPSNNP